MIEAINQKEFTELVQYVKDNFGINLTQKKSLVVGRLHHYIIQNGYSNFAEYLDHIKADTSGEAGSTLVNKITTNHTFFMREPDHFAYMKDTVLPHLMRVEAGSRDLRMWSAGCSSGEEPYTLAMLMDSYLATEKWRWDAKILATDISGAALEKAVEGIYLTQSLSNLPQDWQKKHFRTIDSEYSAICPKVKNEVIFRRFNLMNQYFPFKKKFHVIFCRNVMIYFDADTKKTLIDKFFEHTERGGFLFIGHSESLHRSETEFHYVAPGIYRKEA